MMRRSDDVFFFTLIDFLLQVFFFGLVLYVVAKATAPGPLSASEEAAKKQLLEKTGVSSLVELTDLLARMAPLDQLHGVSEFVSGHGGLKGVKASVETLNQAGGADKVKAMAGVIASQEQQIDGLKTEMKAWGTPSCIYETVAGKTRPRNIAQVRVYDNRIELDSPTAEMQNLLNNLGLQFAAVKMLDHAAFRRIFAPIVAQQPNCRYFLEVKARPNLYSSMQVVWSAFRTQ